MSNNNLPSSASQTQINALNTAGNILKARNAALKPTQYSARITRDNPCAVIILIDQSGSMRSEITNHYGEIRKMSEAVAEIVNELFESLIMKCQRDNMVRDYFNFLVIGYGKEINNSGCSVVWDGNLSGKEWVNVSELKSNLLRTESFTKKETMPWGAIIEEVKTRKIWFNNRDDGESTPMYEALQLCKAKVELWATNHQESFPPMVFNITDGLPSDIDDISDLVSISNDIKSISTQDGHTLLFNCLLTNSSHKEIILPSENEKPDFEKIEYHLALFEASSFLPNELKKTAFQVYKNDKYLHEEVKGVILNSRISTLVQLLNIGTNSTLSNAND